MRLPIIALFVTCGLLPDRFASISRNAIRTWFILPTTFVIMFKAMANIGGGRGRCSFCDSECRDTRTHECGVLFQISIMMGHTFQPEHFPIMPVMQKYRTAPSSISIPPPTPAQPGSNAASSSTPTRPDPPVHRAIAVDESHASPSPLHACPHCHTTLPDSHRP